MTRLSHHLRSNLVAYLALFVALGGTSYAAVNLPTGSVGNRQIRNHSITPIKFDPSRINGSLRYWAVIDGNGRVLESSSPKPRTFGFGSGEGEVNWGRLHQICFPLATVNDSTPEVISTLLAGELRVQTFAPSGAQTPRVIDVALLCAH